MLIYRLRIFGFTVFEWEVEAVTDGEVISNVGGEFERAETPPEECDEEYEEDSGFGFRTRSRR